MTKDIFSLFDEVNRTFGRNRVLGYNSLFDDVRRNFPTQDVKYPPHNTIHVKDGDSERYVIEVAVAGFSEEDLSINLDKSVLTISATNDSDCVNDCGCDEGSEYTYIHKGLAKRDFNLSFRLHEYAVVDSAAVTNGVLVIEISVQLPEEKKPKQIPIGKSVKKETSFFNR